MSSETSSGGGDTESAKIVSRALDKKNSLEKKIKIIEEDLVFVRAVIHGFETLLATLGEYADDHPIIRINREPEFNTYREIVRGMEFQERRANEKLEKKRELIAKIDALLYHKQDMKGLDVLLRKCEDEKTARDAKNVRKRAKRSRK